MGRHTSISARSNFPSAQPTFDTSARRHLGPSCQSHAHTIALTCGAYCPVASSALIRWILPLAPRTHRAVSPLRASPTYRNGLPQLARAMTGIRRPVTPFKKPKPHLAPIKAAAVPPSPVFNLALHRIRESPSLPGHHTISAPGGLKVPPRGRSSLIRRHSSFDWFLGLLYVARELFMDYLHGMVLCRSLD
jgi:hypothetical protein